MSTFLVRHAEILVTMDDRRREIPDGGLFIRDGFIEQAGPTAELPTDADEIIELKGHIVFPGLINTHHHFYQTLTRAVPAAQDANLFNWLKTLYPIWARMQPEDIRISTQTALSELALSGCTTASDHLYLFPNGSRLDDEILAAREVERDAALVFIKSLEPEDRSVLLTRLRDWMKKRGEPYPTIKDESNGPPLPSG